MGADKATFAVDRPVDQDRKSRDRMWRQSRDRKYVLRMRNRKLRTIRPSGVFWPEVKKWRDRKKPWPEVCSAHTRLFPAFFS